MHVYPPGQRVKIVPGDGTIGEIVTVTWSKDTNGCQVIQYEVLLSDGGGGIVFAEQLDAVAPMTLWRLERI